MKSSNAYPLILLIVLMVQCAAYKILVVFPCSTKSHGIIGRGVVHHLLRAGHEVTYITPIPINKSVANLREISIKEDRKEFPGLDLRSLMIKENHYDSDKIFQLMINITNKTLTNENVVKFLNDPTEKFDVVITQWLFNEVFSGFATVYGCPHIWYSIHEPSFIILRLIDEVTNPSYIAGSELNMSPPLTFWQRMKSLQYQAAYMLRNYLVHSSIEKEVYEKTFQPILAKRNEGLPSYEQVRFNTSLIFGNYHVSLGRSITLPQNYIPVGGQHIEEDVKPLPEDLKKIFDESPNGVIYFSMGSMLKSSDLPNSIKEKLVKMFSSLKQTVIWKFEDKLPNLPKNVFILPWAPQHSILSHPRCLLFISHGGLLSTIEAVHFAMPFIGIPVHYDQMLNVKRSVEKGIAIEVGLTDQLVEHLEEALRQMLNNPSYRERMKEVSFIYHHRPTPPGQELVHWTEHVIRTKGAPHLRSPALLLPWYQKTYLDLALVLLILVVCVLHGIKFCIIQRAESMKLKTS